MKRPSLKVLAAIAVLVVASITVVYLCEAQIDYWLQVYAYREIENQEWVTLDIEDTSYPGTFTTAHCRNRGLLSGSFDILVTLVNASFPEDLYEPSQIINKTTVKLPITLHGLEETHADVYFRVDENTTRFVISIALRPNQLLMRHTETNWYGQSVYPYYSFDNNTWYPAQIE